MPVIDRARWVELEPLLDHALDLSDEDRAPWLAQLRSRSPELANDLTSLLSGEVVADRAGFLTEAHDATHDVTLAGLQLGAYTLERPLGQGGMGTVWLARRTDGRFEGQAAVKLLNLALLSAVGQERFRREGTMLAHLAHPGIARISDAGVSAIGQPYLVLEYVDGQRVDVYANERALTHEARIRLVLQVLSAVGHAHANLIVHRDIKPSNILVTTDGTAKLLDFGIAKLIASDSNAAHGAEMPPLTVEGGRALTPEFAAPEQARGEAVTTATDVYACGVLLYLLLSGKHPTSDGVRAPAEAIRALFEVEPKRLGFGDLDNVLAKALRKAPQERYQTAAAFADDLERNLRHEPVSAQRDSFAYRARKFVRRNRVPVFAGLLTAAGLVAATLVSVDRMRDARRQRDVAVYEKQRADAQIEFQYLMLTGIGNARVTMREIIDQGRILLAREYATKPQIAASIALSLAGRYSDLGEAALQATMLDQADSLAIAAGGTSNIPLLVRCSRILLLSEQDRADHAKALVDSIGPSINAAAPEDAAPCIAATAEVAIRAGRFDSAATIARRAAAMMESLGDTLGLQYIGVLNTEANALENIKRRRDALTIYQRIAAVMDSSGRDKVVSRNVIRNNIGIALSNLGEMTAAEPILRETVREFLGSNPAGFVHPAILVNYCRTALFLQKLDTAATWYGRLFKQAVQGNDVTMQEIGAYGMAEVELARGRLAEAARWIAEQKKASARLSKPQPGGSLVLDAALAHAQRNITLANTTFESALRAMGYFDNKRTYQLRGVLVRASGAALDAQDAAKAREYAQAARGIAFSDSLSDTRSAYVGEARLAEARALLARGNAAEARGALTLALTALRFGVGPEHPLSREAETVLAGVR